MRRGAALVRFTKSSDEAQLGQYHYPSIIQAADVTLHATYSFFVAAASVTPDAEKRLPRRRSSTRIQRGVDQKRSVARGGFYLAAGCP
jgi:hypothetical protein